MVKLPWSDPLAWSKTPVPPLFPVRGPVCVVDPKGTGWTGAENLPEKELPLAKVKEYIMRSILLAAE